MIIVPSNVSGASFPSTLIASNQYSPSRGAQFFEDSNFVFQSWNGTNNFWAKTWNIETNQVDTNTNGITFFAQYHPIELSYDGTTIFGMGNNSVCYRWNKNYVGKGNYYLSTATWPILNNEREKVWLHTQGSYAPNGMTLNFTRTRAANPNRLPGSPPELVNDYGSWTYTAYPALVGSHSASISPNYDYIYGAGSAGAYWRGPISNYPYSSGAYEYDSFYTAQSLPPVDVPNFPSALSSYFLPQFNSSGSKVYFFNTNGLYSVETSSATYLGKLSSLQFRSTVRRDKLVYATAVSPNMMYVFDLDDESFVFELPLTFTPAHLIHGIDVSLDLKRIAITDTLGKVNIFE